MVLKADWNTGDLYNASDQNAVAAQVNTNTTGIAGKVDKNSAVTGATKTKITFDAKGLVTAGADATTADIADSTNKRYVTDTQAAVLGATSGTNTGDQTSVSGNAGTATKLATARSIDGQAFDGSGDVTVIAPGTHAASSKATPVDADELPLADSAASFGLKKLTLANLKAWVKSWIAKADVGLGSVDNTADSAKNVLSATKLTTARTINGVSFDGTGNITVNAVDSTAREPAITAGTSAQYWRGDKTMATLNQDAVPDGTTNKAYTATEKTKLAGIATSATANDTDANLKNRANHTGTQTASTISDFNTAADARVTAGITGKVDKSTLTTKGDLYVATASGAVTRIGVGSDGQVVQADSTQTAGIKWATPAGGGDASTNTASSVDSEIALFSGTGGKTVKRATQTGLAKLTSGVLSAATDGTDYVSPKTAGVVSNVLASGADPTGATGDLGAIITSLASSLHTAGGGTIYVPPGTYRFTTTGTINSPLVSLQGAGANATHFVANSALGTNACLDTSARTGFTVLYGGRFGGFSVDGTAATSGVGLRYGDMIRGHLDDIFIDNYTTGAALEFTNRTQWTERTLLTRVTLGRNNRIGWRFTVNGGMDSFGYTRAVDCALNIGYVAATVTRTSVTTTAGSTSATVASGGFPSVTTGMSVDGVGLYGGTTVSAVASNTLTLSIPAKASGAVTLKFASACQRGIVVDSSAYVYNGELALIVNADSGTEGTNQAPVLFDVAGNVDNMAFLVQGEATTGKSTVANIASGGQINGTGFTVLYGFTAGYLGGTSVFEGDGDAFLFPKNTLELRQSVPGDNPMIIADGPDSDVAMVFQTKGNGAFVLWQDTGQTVARMFADGTASDVDFSLESKGAGSVKANGVPVATTTGTQTLTNKRITRRVTTINAPGATPTVATDSWDQINYTGLSAAITSLTTNLTGTPTDGQELTLRFKDNGTARAITHGASFVAGTAALLTTTAAGKTHLEKFLYDSAAGKWACILGGAVSTGGY